jgi:hypothetical protein
MKSSSKPKEPVREATIDEVLHARFVQRVREQVAGGNHLREVARGLRMTEDEVQAVLDANP